MKFKHEIDLNFDEIEAKLESQIRDELNDLAGKLADVLNHDSPISANNAAYLHAMLSSIVKPTKYKSAPLTAVEREAARHEKALADKAAKAERKSVEKVVKLSARESVDAGFFAQA